MEAGPFDAKTVAGRGFNSLPRIRVMATGPPIHGLGIASNFNLASHISPATRTLCRTCTVRKRLTSENYGVLSETRWALGGDSRLYKTLQVLVCRHVADRIIGTASSYTQINTFLNRR